MVLRAAAAAGIRIVLLNAYYKFSGFGDKPLGEAQRRFETDSIEGYYEQLDRLAGLLGPTQSLGVVAHSLRAVSLPDLARLHAGSVERKLPFHLHLEEQPLEIEQCLTEHGVTPMELLLDTIEADGRTTAVHCNHTRPEYLRAFAAKGGNVCICPLTEGNLGDGTHAELHACGSNVCLGTDCNARICFLEEMRWLEYSQRLARVKRGVSVDMPGAVPSFETGPQLLRLATRVGARSLCLPVGAIEPGLKADFVAVDLVSPALAGVADDALAAALVFGVSSQQVVRSTCVDGVWRDVKR